ncbi:MAG: universal stress protein [Deltaproteobacteria bacterium]|nr:universal stress protein [Deltaproteobacteria bacterium]
MQIKKILVPTDFSAAARSAFRFSLTLARGCCADVRLLNVIDLPTEIDEELLVADPDTKDKLLAMKKDAFDDAAAKMASFEAAEDLGGVTVRRYFEIGDVHAAVVRSIAEQGIDLVVLGTNHRPGLDRFMLGGHAYRIVRGVGCPITVVRSEE